MDNIYWHRIYSTVWTSCCGKYLRAITNVLKNMVVKIVIKIVITSKTYTADKHSTLIMNW